MPKTATNSPPYPASLLPVLTQVDTLIRALELGTEDATDLGALLYSVSLDAWSAGVNASPNYLLAASTAGEVLGISSVRVRQLATEFNLGGKIRNGAGELWLFTPDDMEKLATRTDRRGRSAAE